MIKPRKLGSGRWQARFRGPDGKTYTGPTTYRTASEARLWADAEDKRARRCADDGTVWVPPASAAELRARARQAPTFREFAEGFLDSPNPRTGKPRRPKTNYDYS
ncbi:MAG: hypothetical protein LBG11_10840, partial [Bifidobacteriaceae bacterium]|nr:hypothetical protein [Bifidobacteriaceae bacterium]